MSDPSWTARILCVKIGRDNVIQALHMRMQDFALTYAKLCTNVCRILHRHMQNGCDGQADKSVRGA